jgi:hypothetical protein
MRGWGWPLCALVDAVISAPAPAPDEARARRLLEEARAEFGETTDVRGLARIAALEARLDEGRRPAKAGLDAG